VNYVKVRVKMPNNKRRTFWARKNRSTELRTFYSVVDEEGGRLDEIVVADKNDIVFEKPARMNLKYAQLEVQGEDDHGA
jgi:ribosome biogenesis SPOUT family RNA methylase Rps3